MLELLYLEFWGMLKLTGAGGKQEAQKSFDGYWTGAAVTMSEVSMGLLPVPPGAESTPTSNDPGQ
jgi:hypothetical protein